METLADCRRLDFHGLKRFEHWPRRRPVNTSAIICPQHRKARMSAQMQTMHAEHADKSELNELSGRVIGCAFTVLTVIRSG
jgi:hypothetical protein